MTDRYSTDTTARAIVACPNAAHNCDSHYGKDVISCFDAALRAIGERSHPEVDREWMGKEAGAIRDKCGEGLTDNGVAFIAESYKDDEQVDDTVVSLIRDPGSQLEHISIPPWPSSMLRKIASIAISEGIDLTIASSTDPPGAAVTEVLDRTARLGEEWTGRPPLGCRVQAGKLVADDDYKQVCDVLQLVTRGEMSKRSAADELGCSRRTIGRALDHPYRYRLD